MIEFLKKLMSYSKNVKTPVDIYDLVIPNNSKLISNRDLQLLKLFLNFLPNRNNLACNIKRFSLDCVFAYIYCEISSSGGNLLSDDMLEISDMISIKEQDDMNGFLHLIDLDETLFNVLTEKNMHKKTIEFINETKLDFQLPCNENDKVYISKYSDVNYFKIIWGTPKYMNYILKDYG